MNGRAQQLNHTADKKHKNQEGAGSPGETQLVLSDLPSPRPHLPVVLIWIHLGVNPLMRSELPGSNHPPAGNQAFNT
jgi:hypothetical protein